MSILIVFFITLISLTIRLLLSITPLMVSQYLIQDFVSASYQNMVFSIGLLVSYFLFTILLKNYLGEIQERWNRFWVMKNNYKVKDLRKF